MQSRPLRNNLPYNHPGAPNGIPVPSPLYPNKLVEYLGEGEFHHVFFGEPCDFVESEEYGGRKIMRVNRADIFHKLLSIESGQFVEAFDLEDAERVSEYVNSITDHADVIMDSLRHTDAFKAAIAEAVNELLEGSPEAAPEAAPETPPGLYYPDNLPGEEEEEKEETLQE